MFVNSFYGTIFISWHVPKHLSLSLINAVTRSTERSSRSERHADGVSIMRTANNVTHHQIVNTSSVMKFTVKLRKNAV